MIPPDILNRFVWTSKLFGGLPGLSNPESTARLQPKLDTSPADSPSARPTLRTPLGLLLALSGEHMVPDHRQSRDSPDQPIPASRYTTELFNLELLNFESPDQLGSHRISEGQVAVSAVDPNLLNPKSPDPMVTASPLVSAANSSDDYIDLAGANLANHSAVQTIASQTFYHFGRKATVPVLSVITAAALVAGLFFCL